MFEPTEHEYDHDVHESMALFERAQVGEIAAIQPQSPERLLLVLDGSNQDDVGMALSRGLKERFACALDVLDARERVASNELAVQAARELDAQAIPKPSGESYEQILQVAEQQTSDLIIIPSPYGRQLEKVGADSTGTVIDVLLARSPVPLIVTRRPSEWQGELFAHVLLVLIGENEAASTAAAWSAGLVAPKGTIELLLVLEREVLENVRRLMQELDPSLEFNADELAQALQRSHVRLHRALQKTSQQASFAYRLSVKQESEPPLEELTSQAANTLLVLALERADHLSHGHVHDRIRETPLPVLVVPHDAKR